MTLRLNKALVPVCGNALALQQHLTMPSPVPSPVCLPVARVFVLLCLCLTALGAPLPAYGDEPPSLDPVLRIRARELTGRSRVIVEFKGTPDPRAITGNGGVPGRPLEGADANRPRRQAGVAHGVGVESLSDPHSTLYTTFADYLIEGTRGTRDMPYLSLSGTSMAPPMVAGTIALMLEANPELTPNAVKALLQYTAEDRAESVLAEGAGLLNTRGAIRMARYFADPRQPIGPEGDEIEDEWTPWSRHLLWGNTLVDGGVPRPGRNAWNARVEWGARHTVRGAPIVWGTGTDDDNIVWSTGGDDNIVWSTANDDNIVWSTASDENIVWSTGGDDNIVWSTWAPVQVLWPRQPLVNDRRRASTWRH